MVRQWEKEENKKRGQRREGDWITQCMGAVQDEQIIRIEDQECMQEKKKKEYKLYNIYSAI